ncbi:puratrophin-1-like isoform X2 [Glandiceps talaboti]
MLHHKQLTIFTKYEAMASGSDHSTKQTVEETPNKDSQEAFDDSVQKTLSKLYPPFRSTAPVVIGQVCQIVDTQYAGDGRTFLTDFLLPAKIQLQILKEEAKLQFQIQGKRKPKDEGWPLCFEDRVIVHLLELSDDCLKTGDFYLQLKSPVPGTILLALTYVYHGRIHSILIPQETYEILFTMEWLHSLNPDENRMVLEHCVVSTEAGLERMSWQEIIGPVLLEKKSRKKSGNKEQKKASSCQKSASEPQLQQPNELPVTKSSTGKGSKHKSGMECNDHLRHETADTPTGDYTPTPTASVSNVSDTSSSSSNNGSNILGLGKPLPIQMLEVNFEVLHSGAAVLTGARDSQGGAVMEIYTNNLIWKHLECCSEEITKVFMYYWGIPREEVREKGMSVVVDARGASTSVLEVLVDALYIFEDNRSGAIHTVYVLLEPHSPLLYLNSTLFRPQVNFKFELLSSIETLHKFIATYRLTHGFSGTFPYKHEDWIRFRMKLEPFMAGCRSAAKYIISATQEVAMCEKPGNAQETIQLIENLEWKIKEIYEDSRLVGLQSEGDAILSRLKSEQSILTKSEDFRDSINIVTMLYNQVHEVVTTLDGLAESKHSQLEQHLQLKLFEEESSKVALWICNDGESFLNTSADIGDTLEYVKAAEREFDEFYFTAMKHISEGEDLLEEASMLVQHGHYEAAGIKDQAKTLKQHLRTFIRNVEERREQVEDTLTLYSQLSQASSWAQLSTKYLAMMDVEHCCTRDGCHKVRKELEQYLMQHPIITEEQFDETRKLAIKLDNTKCQEELVGVQEHCQDIEQLVFRKLKSLDRLREQLKLETVKKKLEMVEEHKEYKESTEELDLDNDELENEKQRTARDETVKTQSSEGSPKSLLPKPRDSSLGSSASEDSGISENNKPTPTRESKARSHNDSSTSSRKSNSDDVVQRRTKVKGKASTLPDMPTQQTNVDIDMRSDGTADNEDEISSDIENGTFTQQQEAWSPTDVNRHLHKTSSLPMSIKLESGQKLTEEDKKRRKKMMHIMGEMLQTEKDYVRALNYIIQHYFPEMERDDIPQSLRGQRGVVFGNLEKIYDFHNRYFLHELEQCENMPMLLSQCFLKWKGTWDLYALYNKNKPKSDSLLSEHGHFFKSKQNELQDKMDLASYLLKPTQRMGKYALLLQDLIKECPEDEPDLQELQEAERIVKFQLRHGNDLLAMDSLKDCDVNVKEQGQLLRQDEFLVYHGRKKYLRHIFLFEELVLFSKTKKTRKGHDIYHYKNSIKTADIGLTENIGESGLKFELWFRKRKVSETYILHARTQGIKAAWTDSVTKLLFKQAFKCKEVRQAELQSMGIGQKPCMDIKPSVDQISDRAVNYNKIKNRGTKYRNSIAVCNFDHTTPTHKRPLSIISVSSSSSTGSGSSVVGSLALANYDTVLAENPNESPKMRHRNSAGTVSVCSAGSSSSSEVSYSTFSPTNTSNNRHSVHSTDSGNNIGSSSNSQYITNV